MKNSCKHRTLTGIVPPSKCLILNSFHSKNEKTTSTVKYFPIGNFLNLATSCAAGQHLCALYVVCVFFELAPVDDGDAGFKGVVLFFCTFFVGSLSVGSAVVGEVADSTNFVEVVPGPGSDVWPVFFCDRDGNGRLVLTPVSLIGKPELEVTNGSNVFP